MPTHAHLVQIAVFAAAGLLIGLGPVAAEEPERILIPAGPFTMGSEAKARDEDAAEKPPHQVDLPAFYIDRCEVTNAQYATFLNEFGRLDDDAGHRLLWEHPGLQLEQAEGGWRPRAGMEDHPVVCVTWYGAMAYARWAGKRLPTEAEWEKAARGTDGRKYPWGPDLDFSRFRLGFEPLAPVGSYPAGASPYGCLDMAGNAWEWTSSLFASYPYDPTDGREGSTAPGRRVARGGSFKGEPEIAHCSYRFRPEPDFSHVYLGFRCAKDGG